MSDEGERLRLGDGRSLGFAEHGDRGGWPLFWFPGTPSSRLWPDPDQAATAAAGARLIVVERPGYGVSTFLRGRRIADWPADAAELADRLGLPRFAVAGGSGGGAYVAACAAALPDRVTAAGFAGCVASLDLPGATGGLSWSRRAAFAASRRMPDRLAAALAAAAPRPDPERLYRALTADAPACDRALLAPPERWRSMVAMTAEAIRPGLAGFARDLALAARPWGVALGAIRCPTHLWQGLEDRAAPPAMGRALAAALPGCQAHFLAGEGHFLHLARWPEILAALRPS